jgi:hypothetical protein
VSKAFAIVRALVFIVLLSFVLAFVPISQGDLKTSVFVSAGTFFLSVLIAVIISVGLKRGKK